MAQPHTKSIYPLGTQQTAPTTGQAVSDGQQPGLPAPVPADEPPRPRRRLRWLLALALVVAAGVALRLTVLAPKPLLVDAVAVTRGVVEETVTNTRAGTVKARLRAGLSPETGGRVVALPFREGDQVAAGQVLLRLDDAIQRASLRVASADVAVAEARAEEACLAAALAETELQRLVELRQQGITSQQAFDSLTSERDRSRATCRAATATLGQTRARQHLAQTQLDLAEIRAPFTGIVAELSTEVGEWITPAPTGISLPPVIDLLDPGSYFVTAPIDEMDAARVKLGQEVRLTVDSHRGQSFQGRLVRVAPYVLDVVEQNRTVEVEAELTDTSVMAELLPGTSADVEVIINQRQQVLQIPTSAIAQGGKVLVVNNGLLEERTVTTGLGNWRNTEITAGLAEGELVVTSRDSKEIKAGARVEIRGRS